jgi:hypothetical protein
MARPERFERVTFAFGGLLHYAANFGIGLSINRKNRVLRLPDYLPRIACASRDSIEVGDEIWNPCKESRLLAARYKIALPL